MYFAKATYRVYDWSKKATALSMLGGLLKAIGMICICSIIVLIISIPSAANPSYTSDLKFIIPILIAAIVVLFVSGSIFSKKSEKTALSDLESKVRADFKFARKIAHKYPENKEWCMDLNPQYAEFVKSGRDETEEFIEDDARKVTPLRLLLSAILAAILVCGLMYFLQSFN